MKNLITEDRSFLSGESKGGLWTGATIAGEDSWKPIDLGYGIYMLTVDGGNPGGNLGLIKGKDGVVLIDNGLEKAANITMKAVNSLAGANIDLLINTHLHADHIACNPHFARIGAKIISHENTRKALLIDPKFNDIGLPHFTFPDATTLYFNEQTIDLIHIANAHTNSDIIVHCREANVIHAGDMFFNKIFPFIDINNGGCLEGYITGQEKILSLADDNTQIIPGHGPLGNKTDLRNAIDMLVEVSAVIKTLVDKGMSMEEVVKRTPLAHVESWAWFHIDIERMTKIIYCLITES